MERVALLSKNIPSIGLFTRTSMQGEEHELVQQFIDYFCTRFLSYNKTYNLAVFIEPRLTSGFPDIVFASYHPSITEKWSAERSKLNAFDLKILTHLSSSRGTDGANVISCLKMPEKQTIISLEKLTDSKLITYKNKKWRPQNIGTIFCVKKLMAFEAKINNISRVIEQTFVNTWFSSHSYALTNGGKLNNDTVQTFKKRGIGLYCKRKGFNKIIESKQISLPSSYISFQFNEWIGNYLAN